MRKIAFFITIVSLIALSSCNNQQSSSSVEVSVPVSVEDVAKKTIYSTLTINGTVSPVGSVTLTTEAEGNYQLMKNSRTGKKYKLGDKVKKGEKIVILQNKEYELSVRIDAQKLSLENAKQTYDKQKSLYEKGGVTLSDLNSSEVEYTNAKYDYEDAQIQMAKLYVTAPFDGVIVDLTYYTPGIRVSSGSEACKLMDYSELILNAEFPEKYITTIKTGQEAFVTNYNLKEDTLVAIITELSPAIDESSRTFKGILMVNNPDLIMRPGMFVKSDVIIEKRDSAIVIDRDLIQNKRRGKVVYVVERNAAVEKRVNIGIENDDEVEILSGLESGEKLVTDGYEMLSNRTKVKVQK